MISSHALLYSASTDGLTPRMNEPVSKNFGTTTASFRLGGTTFGTSAVGSIEVIGVWYPFQLVKLANEFVLSSMKLTNS